MKHVFVSLLMLAALPVSAEELDTAASHFQAKDYETAAVSAFDIASNGATGAAEARLILGKSLYRMGLLQSAVTQFSQLVALGGQNAASKKAIEWLVFISRKTASPRRVSELLSQFSDSDFSASQRSEIHYLLARYHLELAGEMDRSGNRAGAESSSSQVTRFARLVPSESPHYAKARFLDAVNDVRRDRVGEAVSTLRQVLKLTAPGAAFADAKLRDLTFMQLGRLAYGQKKYRHAAAYYRKVVGITPRWLDAQFESTWANFKLGQDDRALGSLITLSSPFFKNEYYPEAYLMRSLIYYENCRFPEAQSVIDSFEENFMPLREELTALLKEGLSAEQYYERYRQGIGSGTEAGRKRAASAAVTDKDLESMNALIAEQEAEIEAIGSTGPGFAQSGLAQTLLTDLKAQRQVLLDRAGGIVKAKLTSESDELSTLVSNALRIKFEIAEYRKGQLEGLLKGKAKGDRLERYNFTVEVDEDEVYWPLKGEYWRDELGRYVYTLTHGCSVHRAGVGPAAPSSQPARPRSASASP